MCLSIVVNGEHVLANERPQTITFAASRLKWALKPFRCFGDLDDCHDGYTLAMWIKAGLKNTHTMVYFTSGGGTYMSHGVVWFQRARNLICWFRKFTDMWEVSAAMSVSTWYHFTTTWHEEQGTRMYRDGVLVASDPNARYSPYTYTGLDNVFLGKHIAVYGEYGEAYIDELIVYEHIVDTEFVKYIYLSYFY